MERSDEWNLPPRHEWLIDEFFGMWRRVFPEALARKPPGGKAFASLIEDYGEPHRAYHTLDHIAYCLREWQSAKEFFSGLVENEDAVKMALWYHDCMYDIRAKDNEAQSADHVRAIIGCSSLPPSFARTIAGLILATKHDKMPIDLDAQVVVDIDLSSLGAPRKVFWENTGKIRYEYTYGGNITNAQFDAGRVAFFERFLGSRPSIYCTGFFRGKYEAKARENIERSMEELKHPKR